MLNVAYRDRDLLGIYCRQLKISLIHDTSWWIRYIVPPPYMRLKVSSQERRYNSWNLQEVKVVWNREEIERSNLRFKI
jgi:hypothetical protein